MNDHREKPHKQLLARSGPKACTDEQLTTAQRMANILLLGEYLPIRGVSVTTVSPTADYFLSLT